jgi:hypothetical protein
LNFSSGYTSASGTILKLRARKTCVLTLNSSLTSRNSSRGGVVLSYSGFKSSPPPLLLVGVWGASFKVICLSLFALSLLCFSCQAQFCGWHKKLRHSSICSSSSILTFVWKQYKFSISMTLIPYVIKNHCLVELELVLLLAWKIQQISG